MKTPTEDHQLMRWLDGTLPPAEREQFEARLDADPELRTEAQSLRQLGDVLRAHLPAEMPVPHADFFNSQIQVRIANLETEAAATSGRQREDGAGWWSWFTLPGFATAAAVTAAVVLAGILVLNRESRPAPQSAPAVASVSAADGTSVLNTFAPNPTVVPHSFHSNEAGATVLMLDGLEELPEDFPLLAGGPR